MEKDEIVAITLLACPLPATGGTIASRSPSPQPTQNCGRRLAARPSEHSAILEGLRRSPIHTDTDMARSGPSRPKKRHRTSYVFCSCREALCRQNSRLGPLLGRSISQHSRLSTPANIFAECSNNHQSIVAFRLATILVVGRTHFYGSCFFAFRQSQSETGFGSR